MQTMDGKGSTGSLPHYSLRLLSANDKELVEQTVALVNLCYRGEGSWSTELGIVRGQRITRESLLSDLSDKDCHVLIAIAVYRHTSESLLACVRTGPAKSTVVGPVTGQPAAYLGMLAVRPKFQSTGLGGALMAAVEARAKEVYCVSRVVMDVLDCRTELLAWYERKGFNRTGYTVAARPFMENKGEELLVDCSFVLLEKIL